MPYEMPKWMEVSWTSSLPNIKNYEEFLNFVNCPHLNSLNKSLKSYHSSIVVFKEVLDQYPAKDSCSNSFTFYIFSKLTICMLNNLLFHLAKKALSKKIIYDFFYPIKK